MARAYWKGYLRLSLVAIGIELYSATKSSSRLSLHQIHKPSGKRVRYQKTAPGIGPIDTKGGVQNEPSRHSQISNEVANVQLMFAQIHIFKKKS